MSLITWVLMTWLCGPGGCIPLPDLGRMTPEMCEELRAAFEANQARDGYRVVGICVNTEPA